MEGARAKAEGGLCGLSTLGGQQSRTRCARAGREAVVEQRLPVQDVLHRYPLGIRHLCPRAREAQQRISFSSFHEPGCVRMERGKRKGACERETPMRAPGRVCRGRRSRFGRCRWGGRACPSAHTGGETDRQAPGHRKRLARGTRKEGSAARVTQAGGTSGVRTLWYPCAHAD